MEIDVRTLMLLISLTRIGGANEPVSKIHFGCNSKILAAKPS